MTASIRIMVAEDQPLARSTTAFLLNTNDGFHVIDEAADGQEAVDLARLHQPDVAVLDYAMPRLSGAQVICEILSVSPKTRVIVYSANDSDAVIEAVIQAGAVAFVPKIAKLDPLVDAIREAAHDHPPSSANHSPCHES
jgi:two-component system nitrate/nitrite response regulator NarL